VAHHLGHQCEAQLGHDFAGLFRPQRSLKLPTILRLAEHLVRSGVLGGDAAEAGIRWQTRIHDAAGVWTRATGGRGGGGGGDGEAETLRRHGGRPYHITAVCAAAVGFDLQRSRRPLRVTGSGGPRLRPAPVHAGYFSEVRGWRRCRPSWPLIRICRPWPWRPPIPCPRRLR